MTRSTRGFTLIELLVVIAIIGLLASIVLASLNSARKKSRDARRMADLKQLQNALELYANENGGKYPLQASQGTLPPSLTPSFISALPSDPSGAQAYQYISNAGQTSYCMGALLEGVLPAPSTTCTAIVLSSVVNYQRGN